MRKEDGGWADVKRLAQCKSASLRTHYQNNGNNNSLEQNGVPLTRRSFMKQTSFVKLYERIKKNMRTQKWWWSKRKGEIKINGTRKYLLGAPRPEDCGFGGPTACDEEEVRVFKCSRGLWLRSEPIKKVSEASSLRRGFNGAALPFPSLLPHETLRSRSKAPESTSTSLATSSIICFTLQENRNN